MHGSTGCRLDSTVTNMLICRVDDLEIHILEPKDAAKLEGLKQGYTSYRNEWIYNGKAEDFITGSLQRFNSNQGFWAGVWWKGQLAGVVGLNEVNHWNRSANIDYMLGAAFRGKGIVTRAVKALIDYCLDQLNLNRIEIHVDPENVKSCAVPERLGFKKEGVLRQKIFYGDSFGDKAIYAVLSSEWHKPAAKAK